MLSDPGPGGPLCCPPGPRDPPGAPPGWPSPPGGAERRKADCSCTLTWASSATLAPRAPRAGSCPPGGSGTVSRSRTHTSRASAGCGDPSAPCASSAQCSFVAGGVAIRAVSARGYRAAAAAAIRKGSARGSRASGAGLRGVPACPRGGAWWRGSPEGIRAPKEGSML